MKINDIKAFESRNKIELPHEDISENGVIGTILIHPEFVFKSEYLKPNMFYNRELACIYHIVSQLANQGLSEIDNFTVINEIEGNKGFKSIISDLPDIAHDIDTWLDELKLIARSTVEEYDLISKKVVTAAFKRESFIKLRELENYVIGGNDDINAVNYKIQTDITKFADTYIINSDVRTVGEKADDIWKKILSRRNNGFSGIPSKYKDLNKYFTYENGELVVIGGRAKSRLLLPCTVMYIANC